MPAPSFTQQIAGATAPNTATGSDAVGPTEQRWQTLVAVAAGLLAVLFVLTPRRRRLGE